MTFGFIEHAEAGRIFTRREAEEVMEELLSGAVPTSAIVRLLSALNSRPYQVEEIVGFALAMRGRAAAVFARGKERPARLVDTCGTGGGYKGVFNISTAAAIVAAAAGARVAKHGNRSSRGGCGSADVVEALGVRIDGELERVGDAIREVGIGFIFARAAHASMRHAAEARQQMATRTVFNLLGPLTNPAGAEAQVVGVFSSDAVDLVARVLAELGVKRAFVVHGEDGLGEISISGETAVAEVAEGTIRGYRLTPADFGVREAPLETLRGGDARENAQIIRQILSSEAGPHRDIVAVNAAAALVASGVAENFRHGAELAQRAIHTGAAAATLAKLVEFMKTHPPADS